MINAYTILHCTLLYNYYCRYISTSYTRKQRGREKVTKEKSLWNWTANLICLEGMSSAYPVACRLPARLSACPHSLAPSLALCLPFGTGALTSTAGGRKKNELTLPVVRFVRVSELRLRSTALPLNWTKLTTAQLGATEQGAGDCASRGYYW